MHIPKSTTGRVLAAGLALSSIACSSDRPMGPSASPSVSQLSPAYQTRHIIVMKDGVTPDVVGSVGARVLAMGGRVERMHGPIGVLVTRDLTPGAAAALASRSDVLGIVPDYVIKVPQLKATHLKQSVGPVGVTSRSDPTQAAFFNQFQWNLRLIRAPQSYTLTKRGKGRLIGDLDTGIDYTHQDLAKKVDMGLSQSFVVTEPGIEDLDFHGTWTASIMVSNGIGMALVAPDAKIVALKVLDQNGQGSFADAIAAVVYAADVGLDAINMSFGAVISKKDPGLTPLFVAFQRAVKYAWDHGVNVQAAAGNDALNLPQVDSVDIPGQLNYLISVGAVGPMGQQNFDNIASYSDFGYPAVTLFAPGGDFATDPSEQTMADLIVGACSSFSVNPALQTCTTAKSFYIWADGTSAAAPHVTAEAAVLRSDQPKNAPNLMYNTMHCILVGSDALTGIRVDPLYGFGVIDMIGGRDCRQII